MSRTHQVTFWTGHFSRRNAAALVAVSLALSACGPVPVRHSDGNSRSASSAANRSARSYPPPTILTAPPHRAFQDGAPSASSIPPNLAAMPDAVPRLEPKSALGNPDSYQVYGERYIVLNDFANFKERGIASWYGEKFHGHSTSSGEPYDMYQMTAAHKTLPIPCYVRVTNLNNSKSVIVRVNDRGPFHEDRIIDLSYVAALKLGVIGEGSAPVEIEALTPPVAMPAPVMTASAASSGAGSGTAASMTALPPGPAAAPTASSGTAYAAAAAPSTIAALPTTTPLAAAAVSPGGLAAIMPGVIRGDVRWLQAGAFIDPINAATLRDQLNGLGIGNVLLKTQSRGLQALHRVLIGPFRDPNDRDQVRDRLASLQLPTMLVTD